MRGLEPGSMSLDEEDAWLFGCSDEGKKRTARVDLERDPSPPLVRPSLTCPRPLGSQRWPARSPETSQVREVKNPCRWPQKGLQASACDLACPVSPLVSYPWGIPVLFLSPDALRSSMKLLNQQGGCTGISWAA